MESLLAAKAGERAYRGFKATVTSGLLGINEATAPALEASYKAFLGELSTHLDSHQFLLGDRPCLADFGMMAPLYAHLGRDPVPHFLMKTQAPRVADYVERTMGGGSARISPVPPSAISATHSLSAAHAERDDVRAWDAPATLRGGGWCADDEIPRTLLPLLERQMQEQLHVVQANSAALGARLAQGWPEGTPLPGGIAGVSTSADDQQGLGWFDTSVFGVATSLAIRPNVTMMAQELLETYEQMVPTERAAVDELLRTIGGASAVELLAGGALLGGCPRLSRSSFRLWPPAGR